MTTFAPSNAKLLQIENPIPVDEAVTNTVLSLNI